MNLGNEFIAAVDGNPEVQNILRFEHGYTRGASHLYSMLSEVLRPFTALIIEISMEFDLDYNKYVFYVLIRYPKWYQDFSFEVPWSLAADPDDYQYRVGLAAVEAYRKIESPPIPEGFVLGEN